MNRKHGGLGAVSAYGPLRTLDPGAIVKAMRTIASAITALALVGASLVACAPPRQTVDLEIEPGPTPGRRCVVIYELQQRAPLLGGMATYWPVHLAETDDAGRLRVSKSLCPNLEVGALGGAGELIEHRGGRKVVVLDDPAVDTPCDAPEVRWMRSSLERQLNDPDPVGCAG